jgi:hypothetical protein
MLNSDAGPDLIAEEPVEAVVDSVTARRGPKKANVVAEAKAEKTKRGRKPKGKDDSGIREI